MTSEVLGAEWGKGNATFVFGDLKGYTAIIERVNNEDVAWIVAQLFARFGTEIERAGGRLAQQFREGDGFLALFGYPTRREDDAERALRCSLELQRICRDSQEEVRQRLGAELPLRLGITTGSVVVERHDWGENFTGDAVNVAARLEGLAEPGEILVSEVTRRLVPDRFEWGPAQTLNVKNRTRAVAARTLRAAVSRTMLRSGSAPFIGRTAELGELSGAWTTALIGDPHIVVVEGAAGIGKSRLVHEFARRLREQGQDPHIALGSAPAFGTAALDPLRRMVIGCRESPEMADVALEPEAAASVDALISAGGGTIRPVRRRAEFVAGLVAFFEQWLNRTPGLIVLEDAHWADRSTLKLLGEIALALREERVLLLILQRPSPSGSLPRSIRRSATWVRLPKFRREDCEHLLDHLLPVVLRADLELRETILAKAEGSPFFIEEIVKMVARSHPPDADGLADTAAADVKKIPESIEQIFLARLDQIDERARRVAQDAAVVGRRFPDELLAAVTEGTVRSALRRLEREDTLRYWESEDAENGHEFTHYLTWNTIYESLLVRRRSELHLKTAAAIEELYPDAVDRFAEVLALHYELGGRNDLAVACYLRAQEKSKAMHAKLEAREQGRRSAKLAGLTSLWSPSRQDSSVMTRTAAILMQFVVGLLLFLPVVVFMVIRKPPESARTIGLPDAVYGLSIATIVVPLILGIVPVFISAVVFANVRASSYLRRAQPRIVLLRDVLVAWAFHVMATAGLVALAFLAVRRGWLGVVADAYFTSTAARVLLGQAGTILATFLGASLVVAAMLVWQLSHKARLWRTYLGRRSQIGHAANADGDSGRQFATLARLATAAIGLSIAALIVQFLPYRSFEVDGAARIASSLFLVVSIAVYAVAVLLLIARSRGITGAGGLRFGLLSVLRRAQLGRAPFRRPGGLGLEAPLALAAIFGIAVLVPVRTGLIQSFQGGLDPLNIEQAETLVRWFPESPFAYSSRANVYLDDGGDGSIEQAISDFEKSLTVDPAFVIAHVGLSSAEARRGNFEAALAAADRWVTLSPTHPTPYLWRSAMRAVNDDLHGALEDRRTALALDGENVQWDALVALCTVKFQLGLTDAALGDCSAATDANPYLLSRSSGFRGAFAELFRAAGRSDEARKIMEAAGVPRDEAAAAVAPLNNLDFAERWDYSTQTEISIGASNDVPGYRGLAAEHGVRDGYLAYFVNQPRNGRSEGVVVQTITLYRDDRGAMFGFDDQTSASGYERFRGGPNFPIPVFGDLVVTQLGDESVELDDEARRATYVVFAGETLRVENVLVVRRGRVVSMYVITSDVDVDLDLVQFAKHGQRRIGELFPDD